MLGYNGIINYLIIQILIRLVSIKNEKIKGILWGENYKIKSRFVWNIYVEFSCRKT